MFAWLIAGSLVVGAPALKDKPPDRDLYGDWDSLQVDGDTGAPAYRYRFNKDGTWQVFRDGEEFKGGFRIDPKKSPAEIDLNSPPDPRAPLILGIYQIEGDRLAISVAEPGKPRPTKFRGPDTGGSLQHLNRVKSKD
jgi:uncharacterized protein (TIGR03067 family)